MQNTPLLRHMNRTEFPMIGRTVVTTLDSKTVEILRVADFDLTFSLLFVSRQKVKKKTY
jgi:hypothetical protein